jgi:UDP-glucose 4-epimerase
VSPLEPERPILVTGGAGFVGSHLVERLLERGCIVVVVDDLSTGRQDNIRAVTARVGDRLRFVHATVSEVLERGDLPELGGIFHLAAAVGVRRVLEQPGRSIETNVLETVSALRLARRHGCPMLLASSSEVYGKATRLPFSETDDIVFGPTHVMRWSYGCAKALDEWLTLAAWRDERVPVVVARLFNTVGPRQSGHWGMVLPRFVEAAMAGRPLEIHGDGLQSRCFADVRDVVRALDQLLGLPRSVGQVYNVGSDEPISIRALAERVVRQLRSDSPLVHLPYETALGSGFEDLRARQPDLARIREAIGFRTTVPLERTISDLAASIASTKAREDAA